MINFLELPLIKRKKIAEDTWEVQLGLGKNKFEYKAGQYVTLIIPKECNDGRGNSRPFSLSSSPNNKKYISTVLRVPNQCSDFKRFLTKCRIKTKIKVRGPHGIFVLPKDKEIILIAGGVGVVPFMSMIAYATEMDTHQKITLLYTDKSEKKMTYLKELKNLAKKNKNFLLIERFKRVDKEFLKKYKGSKESKYLICGTPDMVSNTCSMLKSIGVSKKQIILEEFSGY